MVSCININATDLTEKMEIAREYRSWCKITKNWVIFATPIYYECPAVPKVSVITRVDRLYLLLWEHTFRNLSEGGYHPRSPSFRRSYLLCSSYWIAKSRPKMPWKQCFSCIVSSSKSQFYWMMITTTVLWHHWVIPPNGVLKLPEIESRRQFWLRDFRTKDNEGEETDC